MSQIARLTALELVTLEMGQRVWDFAFKNELPAPPGLTNQLDELRDWATRVRELLPESLGRVASPDGD